MVEICGLDLEHDQIAKSVSLLWVHHTIYP
jgi:hypothetical protein